MVRSIAIYPIGLVVGLLVFWLMQWMIEPSKQVIQRDDDIAMIDFIRSLQDSSSDRKNRNPKEPPKPKTPPMPKSPKIQQASVQNIQMDMPDIKPSFSNIKGNGLGNMLSGFGFGDTNAIPLVQIVPRYPPQAQSRGIEGVVTIKFIITKEGTVEDVSVVSADPVGVFEREAIRAAWRYKFKPKLVDGKPVEQTAVLPFEFTLEK